MPVNSRAKGARGERELAACLRKYGFDARRGQQHAGGVESPDIRHNIPGLHLECKRVERLNIRQAYEQACGDCGDLMPVVVFRQNRTPWMVALSLDDFAKLLLERQQRGNAA